MYIYILYDCRHIIPIYIMYLYEYIQCEDYPEPLEERW